METYKRTFFTEAEMVGEGIEDYHDEKSARREDFLNRTEELIKEFLSKNFNTPEEVTIWITEQVLSLPKYAQNFFFEKFLEATPEEALLNIHLFNHLLYDTQEKIAQHLDALSSCSYSVYEHIIEAFSEITDMKMTNWFVQNVPFSLLAKYKEKFRYASDKKILERLGDIRYTNFCWSELIPFLEKFPNINKEDAIRGVMQANAFGYASKGGIIFEYREKLGLSMEQAMDLFREHKKVFLLAGYIKNIDTSFHQEIADSIIAEKNIGSLFANAQDFQNIDIVGMWNAILLISFTKGKDITPYYYRIEDNLSKIPLAWAEKMPQEIIDYLLNSTPSIVAHYTKLFEGRIDKIKLTNNLFAKGRFDIVITESENLDVVCDASLALRILDFDGYNAESAIRYNISKFEKLPREVYLRLLKRIPNQTAEIVTEFDGILEEDFIDAIEKLPSSEQHTVRRILDQDGISLNKSLANILIKGHFFSVLLERFDEFTDVDATEVACTIIEAGGSREVGLSHTKLSDFDHEKVITTFLKQGNLEEIYYWFTIFSEIREKKDIGKKIFNECLISDSWRWDNAVLKKIIEIFSLQNEKECQSFEVSCDMLGEAFVNRDLYTTIHQLLEGDAVPAELHSLGITERGNAGKVQLLQKIERFREEMTQESFDAKKMLDFPLLGQYYASFVRYEESQWGDHEDESFQDIVSSFSKLRKNGELRTLPDAYVSSEGLRVARIDREAQETFQYSEQFKSRYATLQKSLKESIAFIGQSKPLTSLLEMAKERQKLVLDGLRDKIGSLENPKAIEHLNKRIEMLHTINFRDVKNLQENFSTLAQFGEFHEILRQLSFFYALHKNKHAHTTARDLVMKEEPSFDDISKMIDFVGHTVNEETWSSHFTDKRSRKVFGDINSIRALEEEFSRAQNQNIKGTVPLEFIPTRGLLMEFSGHIADACWASKYQSISKSFPNFISVIMMQNRGTKFERLSGASMLIETESQNGEPLLVIRGLNPIENLINELSVEDFFNKFTDYLKTIANKTEPKRKLAIVIDDHAGGSGTNRPILFRFLEEKKGSLERIKLKSGEDSTFNNYYIVNDTYLID